MAGNERDGGDQWGNVYGPSIYITPPVDAVSFVTSRHRRLVAGLVPGLIRTLSPPTASLVVLTISSTFSSKSTIAKFCNARQTKMADIDSNIQHRQVTYLYDSGIPVPVRIRKQSRYTGVWRTALTSVPPVYRLPTPRGSLRKAGNPACDATGKFAQSRYTGSDVLRVKRNSLVEHHQDSFVWSDAKPACQNIPWKSLSTHSIIRKQFRRGGRDCTERRSMTYRCGANTTRCMALLWGRKMHGVPTPKRQSWSRTSPNSVPTAKVCSLPGCQSTHVGGDGRKSLSGKANRDKPSHQPHKTRLSNEGAVLHIWFMPSISHKPMLNID